MKKGHKACGILFIYFYFCFCYEIHSNFCAAIFLPLSSTLKKKKEKRFKNPKHNIQIKDFLRAIFGKPDVPSEIREWTFIRIGQLSYHLS